MPFFVDVILPLSLSGLYTYEISEQEFEFLTPGMRVVVPFGKNKIYTAIVGKIHQNEPSYPTKEISQILDDIPILTKAQLVFFEWISSYYMLNLGDILKSVLPNAFLLESKTMIEKSSQNTDYKSLTDDECLIIDALQTSSSISVEEALKILGNKKKSLSIIEGLAKKNYIQLLEKIYEKYTPKILRYIRLKSPFDKVENIKLIFDQISEKATAQRKILISFFSLKTKNEPIKASDLIKESQVSSSVLNELIRKDIFEEYFLQTDRIDFSSFEKQNINLTENQQIAFDSINEKFQKKEVVLLKGASSSGKTIIYIKQIENTLKQGEQVLLLVPEIGLSVQLINRLKHFFGEKMSVYHSKYSTNERVEVWYNLLNNSLKTQLIVGVQSSIFLPFTNLGLVIIDEEHDAGYKEQNKLGVQTRDAAIVLAHLFKAKTLLGSSTPSVESYFNSKEKKYEFVKLLGRYKDIQLPEIQLVDLKDQTKRKKINGHFSDILIQEIKQALEQKKQVILFQNRRGYAPFLQCDLCHFIPHCPNCDVSLTYHQLKNQLRCHYCGHNQPVIKKCPACNSLDLTMKGVGTEKIEEEIFNIFPEAKIARMDKDSTKGKHSYEKIFNDFENGEIDILVGTQMVSKGIDFQNVSLVGIINADFTLFLPDFRSVERTFQQLTQIAGRAGRHNQKGKVIIQTYNPHQIIYKQIVDYQYDEMIENQIREREDFHYPPFYRLIKISFKDKNLDKLNEASLWFSKGLKQGFSTQNIEVLGPEFPSISKIRNEYFKNILVKIPKDFKISAVKHYIKKIEQNFYTFAQFRSVLIFYNVDI